MFKKTMLFAAALAMIVSIAGCACSGTVGAAPTPSIAPAATPSAELVEPSPDVLLTPDMQASPDAGAGSDTDSAGGAGNANGTSDAAGTGGTGSTGGTATGTATISNFKEGTEVSESDVPEIASAVKAKYENATVKSIKHAMRNNQQVYEVEVTSGSTTKTVYVTPDGTVTEQ